MIKLFINIGKVLLGLSILAIGIKMIPWKNFESQNSIESVMQDVTETSLAKPDSISLLGLLHLEENKHDGATFRYTNLNEVSQNQVFQVVLPSTQLLLSNEMERDKQIRKFKDEVGSILLKSLNDSIGRSYSSVYVPIAKELTLLSESKAQSKSLIIYSDLMENSSELSFYGYTGKELLNNHAVELIQKFNQMYPIPQLNGIHIYLVYQPSTISNDVVFKKISQVYKTMLTNKGATVYIQANLLKNQ